MREIALIQLYGLLDMISFDEVLLLSSCQATIYLSEVITLTSPVRIQVIASHHLSPFVPAHSEFTNGLGLDELSIHLTRMTSGHDVG